MRVRPEARLGKPSLDVNIGGPTVCWVMAERGQVDDVSKLLVAPEVSGADAVEMRAVSGGLLLQHTDRFQAPGDDPSAWQLAAGSPASPEVLADLAMDGRTNQPVDFLSAARFTQVGG